MADEERERILREARETIERPAHVAQRIAPTLRLTDAEIAQFVDERIEERLAQERAETDRRIAEAQCVLLNSISKVLDDIDHALANASEKFDGLHERQKRLSTEIAETRALAASEGAEAVDCPAPLSSPRKIVN